MSSPFPDFLQSQDTARQNSCHSSPRTYLGSTHSPCQLWKLEIPTTWGGGLTPLTAMQVKGSRTTTELADNTPFPKPKTSNGNSDKLRTINRLFLCIPVPRPCSFILLSYLMISALIPSATSLPIRGERSGFFPLLHDMQ